MTEMNYQIVQNLLIYRVFEDSSTKKKIKYPGHFLNESNNCFVNGRERFTALVWFQISNMSPSLETEIEVVIIMAK